MQIIEILKAIILGIVEGVTEWLPISSTGHMILVNQFLHQNMSEEFKKMFLVVIQFGAVLAVVVLFWNKLFPFAIRRKGNESVIKKDIFVMWFKILIACIPAAVVGLLWDDKIDELFYNYQTVSIALIVVGIWFIIVENKNAGKKPRVISIADITYKDAIIIGLFQLVSAVFPGTSRSGATIIGAMMVGVSRGIATEFTFFLAVPVMFGASLLKIAKFGFSFTMIEGTVLFVGMAVAFAVSMVIIKALTGYVKKHDFKIFGWYRIVLGCAVLGFFLIKGILG
ncbi:undecaprenyl-diphosphate phosphatase [[Clostridium] fimetarium]|uniref:Undecaprenyl-diphosphatase n=1 Tax=[Clostridium] fimetarium TaxID=99656 RepID=A0A1I0MF81_9FIRM|nr:undecaprenyl-diphosphate phosphatase [[Clostridium] fimetarium]SEV86929.1 undecaprenyl-diphosphatase [[Clostridium] fimetarium]